jgi:hypothetical protein
VDRLVCRLADLGKGGRRVVPWPRLILHSTFNSRGRTGPIKHFSRRFVVNWSKPREVTDATNR